MFSRADHDITHSQLILSHVFAGSLWDQISRIYSWLREEPSIANNPFTTLHIASVICTGIVGDVCVDPLHTSVNRILSCDAS